MKAFYFTFGQNHVHRVQAFTWDCDVVCQIMAQSMAHARQIMFQNFGDQWSMCYEQAPEMHYFPRGIKRLN